MHKKSLNQNSLLKSIRILLKDHKMKAGDYFEQTRQQIPAFHSCSPISLYQKFENIDRIYSFKNIPQSIYIILAAVQVTF